MYQQNTTTSEAARLEDYIRAVRLRKWVVIGMTAAGIALGMVFASSGIASYSASSSLLVAPVPAGSGESGRMVQPNLEKEREIVLSNQTASDAALELGFEGDPTALLQDLRVAFRPDSDVMTITYVSTDPQQAADTANAFTLAYANRRETTAVNVYQSVIDVSQTQLDEIEIEIVQLQIERDALTAQRRDLLVNEEAGPERENAVAIIDESLQTIRQDLNGLNSTAQGFEKAIRDETSRLTTRAPSFEVLRSATAPSTPDGLSSNLYAVAGGLLGFILGIVTAFLLDRLDNTARDDHDVALALGTEVIGSIPTLGLGNRSGSSALIMLSSGGRARLAGGREAYRRLRSSVQFLQTNNNVSSLVVTSASPSEGKSVTCANLAIALAQSGSRVALVSADLRRPTQESLFGIEPNGEGLSGYLGRGTDLSAIEVPDIPNLWIVDAGPAPANPGELLGSARFRTLMDDLDDGVDFTIVDTPPILSTADALAASSHVDGVIVVVDTRRTETTELLQVRSDLERSGAKVLGAVMNRRRFKRGGLLSRRKNSYYRTERKPLTSSGDTREAA